MTVSGRLYALLVGIDAYPPPIPRLTGCVNDVTAFADVLRERVGDDALDLVVLTDAGATRESVTQNLSAHLGRARGDDVALFYYSGHGSQQATPQELWSIEPDHRNETLVCVDSREPGSWDLADKELGGLLAGISASGCHALVVLDCCHSGDGTRDADEVVRLAPADPRPTREPAASAAGPPSGSTSCSPRAARPRRPRRSPSWAAGEAPCRWPSSRRCSAATVGRPTGTCCGW